MTLNEHITGTGTLVTALGAVTFRLAAGTAGRAALEVLRGGELIGVHVDTRFSALVLGALRGGQDGPRWALAWGRLPPAGERPAVTFLGGWPGRRVRAVAEVGAVGMFWVAHVPGRFRTVAVSVNGVPAARQHRRLARLDPD